MIFTSLLLLTALSSVPHEKIVGGFVDGNEHPYVCALATRGSVGQYYPHCSLTLLDARHLLAIGHCSWNPDHDEIGDWRTTVSCRSEIDPVGEWRYLHHGNLYVGPHGIALVELDEPLPWTASDEVQRLAEMDGRTMPPLYARLPTLNQLASRDTDQITIVGYGKTNKAQDQNFGARVRYWGAARYKSRGDHTLTLSGSSPSEICGGDSGGPALLGSTNIVVGVADWTSGNCSGDQVYERVDIPEVRAFFAAHGVVVP